MQNVEGETYDLTTESSGGATVVACNALGPSDLIDLT